MGLVGQDCRTPGPGALPFHIGIAVPDLDAAMEELTAAFGITWREPRNGDSTPATLAGPARLVSSCVYSVDGLSCLELGQRDKTLASPGLIAGLGDFTSATGATMPRLRAGCFEEIGMTRLFQMSRPEDLNPTGHFHVSRSGLVIEVLAPLAHADDGR